MIIKDNNLAYRHAFEDECLQAFHSLVIINELGQKYLHSSRKSKNVIVDFHLEFLIYVQRFVS